MARSRERSFGFFSCARPIGIGFLGSVYYNALAHEFTKAGVAFEREVPMTVWYDGISLGSFRTDFVVEGPVVAEVKASELVSEGHRKQLLNWMRASDREVGLLLHFGTRAAFNRILYTNDRKPELRTITKTLRESPCLPVFVRAKAVAVVVVDIRISSPQSSTDARRSAQARMRRVCRLLEAA
jgi:GxxExxY protein